MSTDEPLDDRWIELLARGDDALGAGSAVDTVSLADVPPELHGQLQRDLTHFQRLRQALRRPSPTTATPLVLGRFHVRRELGRGAFGVVFLAPDSLLGRDVAVKVPRADALVTPELRERFQREARAAAGLDHPNIVPVYEAGAVGPLCFVVSAYCSGPTLAQWLQQQTEPVPFLLAARLLATLAEAIEHAHRHGVVHRDLKPSNVLLTFEDRGSHEAGVRSSILCPKITDFGLAKLRDGGPASEGQTRSGAILGSIPYMAPEQAAGKSKEVGPPADVYALGAMLYELLTGRPPFRGESDLDTLQQVQLLEPVSPSQLRPQCPRDLQTACLKCLHKEPARRYAGAGALADDLRRFLVGKPIAARPVSRAEGLGRWARRHPARALAAGLGVVAGLAVVGLGVGSAFLFQLRQEQEQTRAALRTAETYRHQAERLSADLALERGLNLADQGEVARGLLWLAHGVELAPPDDADLQRAARANLADGYRRLHSLRRLAALQPGARRRLQPRRPDRPDSQYRQQGPALGRGHRRAGRRPAPRQRGRGRGVQP